MKVLTVLGLGLMGGSLGLAVKQRTPGVTVHGFTRSRARGELALERGAVDQFHDNPVDAVAMADVIVCCAPILAIADQLRSVVHAVKPGAVVTDVGSTKADVQRACGEIVRGREVYFVGSHPIAGSEQQGMEAARADLYDKALVVVTSGPETPPHPRQAIRGLWESVGGAVVEMPPEHHDEMLAATSHLPHVAASLLAATIGRAERRADWPRFCGTGYRDSTRIAEGGVDIWMDILRTNRMPVAHELKIFRAKLDAFIEKLELHDDSAIENVLGEGKDARRIFATYGTQTNSEE